MPRSEPSCRGAHGAGPGAGAPSIMSFEFLVIGAGRSGTGLLAGLLDSHPRLEVGFEQDSEAILLAAGEPSWRRAMRFRSRCEECASGFPEQQWGNKITTEQIRGLEDDGRDPAEALAHFFDEVMRGITKICILRDGRTCVRSKMNRNRRGLAIEEASRRWCYSVFVHDFLADRGDAVVLRFEDLVADARSVLMPVCDRLGVEWDDAILAGTRNEKLPPEYRQTGFNPAPTVVDDLPAGCMSIIEADLHRLGYLDP